MGSMQELHTRVQASFADPGKKFFDMFLLEDDEDAETVTVQKAVDWLYAANSSYRSWCIPRMPGRLLQQNLLHLQ